MPKAGRLVDNGDGTSYVNLGGLFTGLILAALLSGGSALVTVGVLAYRANAEQAKVETVEKKVGRQGRNQIRMDENQRRIRQDAEWANAKLDKLLEALQVSERVPRPALPPSCLEKPTDHDGE